MNDQNIIVIEELEAKIEYLESDKCDVDDRLEEYAREIFDLKQNGTQEETTQAVKFLAKKRLSRTQNDLTLASETILMLENKLDNRLSEIKVIKREGGKSCCILL